MNLQIMRDTETGNSKGFGFVKYDSFEAGDLAIECMNNQVCVDGPRVCTALTPAFSSSPIDKFQFSMHSSATRKANAMAAWRSECLPQLALRTC